MTDNFSGGSDMWNERFKKNKHLYTTSPNLFFKQYLEKKQAGKILLPGDGEGRNGVFAASSGWEVTSFDYSETGIRHSRELAAEHSLHIDAQHASLEEFTYEKEYFDLVAIIFLHLPSAIRQQHFPRLLNFLKPTGEIYIFGYSKDQIQNQSGGPKDINMLYSTEELSDTFGGMNILKNEKFVFDIDEGPKHQGKASLVEFIARFK